MKGPRPGLSVEVHLCDVGGSTLLLGLEGGVDLGETGNLVVEVLDLEG